MNIRRDPDAQPHTLEVKRAYFPFIVSSTCPKCGQLMERYLANDYLSFPTIGAPTHVDFVHEIEGPKYRVCARWSERIVIDYTATVVP